MISVKLCILPHPPSLPQTWGCSCSSTPGLLAALLWTHWPVSITRGRSQCAFPGKARWWALWKLIGWNWLPPTIAKAGHWWTRLSTGTHQKVGFMLVNDILVSLCYTLYLISIQMFKQSCMTYMFIVHYWIKKFLFFLFLVKYNGPFLVLSCIFAYQI